MIELNFTLWVQAVNFIVLLVFLNIFVFKPILKVAEERDAKMSSLERKARQAEEKTARALADYEQKVADMRRESSEAVAAARKEASEKAGQVMADARAEFNAQLAASRQALEKEAADAAGKLRQDVEGFAETLAARVLGR